jgi:hypothetical protein|tara:strand:- start:3219 stop:3419 length:201 start_codon:yes stop_codon:yes gene_type:complete
MNKFFYITILIYFFSLLSNAYAYLDPGTGSIILTGLISFFALMLLNIKIFIQKIKDFLKKNKNKDK